MRLSLKKWDQSKQKVKMKKLLSCMSVTRPSCQPLLMEILGRMLN